MAEARLDDVRAKLADLRTMERVLGDTVARGAEDGGSHCPLIEALYRDGTPEQPPRRAVRGRRGRRVSGQARGA